MDDAPAASACALGAGGEDADGVVAWSAGGGGRRGFFLRTDGADGESGVGAATTGGAGGAGTGAGKAASSASPDPGAPGAPLAPSPGPPSPAGVPNTTSSTTDGGAAHGGADTPPRANTRPSTRPWPANEPNPPHSQHPGRDRAARKPARTVPARVPMPCGELVVPGSGSTPATESPFHPMRSAGPVTPSPTRRDTTCHVYFFCSVIDNTAKILDTVRVIPY